MPQERLLRALRHCLSHCSGDRPEIARVIGGVCHQCGCFNSNSGCLHQHGINEWGPGGPRLLPLLHGGVLPHGWGCPLPEWWGCGMRLPPRWMLRTMRGSDRCHGGSDRGAADGRGARGIQRPSPVNDVQLSGAANCLWGPACHCGVPLLPRPLLQLRRGRRLPSRGRQRLRLRRTVRVPQ